MSPSQLKQKAQQRVKNAATLFRSAAKMHGLVRGSVQLLGDVVEAQLAAMYIAGHCDGRKRPRKKGVRV